MTSGNVEMLRPEYDHPNRDSLISGLRLFLEMYADMNKWRESKGEPPHLLREGVQLDFHPGNVVDGYSFAQEAIAHIDKFYADAKSRGSCSDESGEKMGSAARTKPTIAELEQTDAQASMSPDGSVSITNLRWSINVISEGSLELQTMSGLESVMDHFDKCRDESDSLQDQETVSRIANWFSRRYGG